MGAYFRMRSIVTDFTLRQRPSRAQIRKSIVSFLRQLHLLLQRVVKHATLAHSAQCVHVRASCKFISFHFHPDARCSFSLAPGANVVYHHLRKRIRPTVVFDRLSFKYIYLLRVEKLDVLLGAMSSIRRGVRRCLHATGWGSRE